MRGSSIRKAGTPGPVTPHLASYEDARCQFSWDAIRRELGLETDGFVNIAHAAVDRHLATPVRNRVAFRFIGRDDRRRDITYAELASLTNRFANALRGLGIGKGDTIALLTGRNPGLYIAALG